MSEWVGWLVGWLVGRLVDWLVGGLVGWLPRWYLCDGVPHFPDGWDEQDCEFTITQ